jgi:predicted site-specific integrase-resolvase
LQSLIISREEAARLLGVSSFTLWRWHKTGFLKPLLGASGRTAAYLRDDVEKIKETGSYLNRLRPGRKKKEASESV